MLAKSLSQRGELRPGAGTYSQLDVGIGIDTKMRLLSESTPHMMLGRDLLDSRNFVLSTVNPDFLELAKQKGDDYNQRILHYFASEPEESRNESHNVRLEPTPDVSPYRELISKHPDILGSLWPIDRLDSVRAERYLKIFAWNYERLKKARNGGGAPQVEIATRFDSIDGNPQPYPVHTHVDVPHGLQFLGLPSFGLTLFLSVFHDSVEVGRDLVYCPNNGVALQPLTPKMILDAFPEENIGIQLAVGIPTLTEVESDDMLAGIPIEKVNQYQSAARTPFTQALQGIKSGEGRISKVFFEDPFVFGGLALQIEKTVRKLSGERERAKAGEFSLSVGELDELMASIIRVEIGDRLSDISTLEGDFLWLDNTECAHEKTVAYTCRMMNMCEKLIRSVSFLPEEMRPDLYRALDGYLSVLLNKVHDITVLLHGEVGKPFNFNTVVGRYRSTYRELQESADTAMSDFIDEQVESKTKILY